MSLLLSLLINQSIVLAKTLQFPNHFRWCVATAAHQIEGGNINSDWWAFEHQKGRIKNGDTTAIATDHWNRVSEDTLLIKKLNVSDYRMSIEWARIEPREGQIDSAAIDHYRQEIQLLLTNGIRPIITLQHFTFPLWVRQKGGFEWKGLPDAFAQFTQVVYRDIAPEVRDWITINEPMVTALGGYVKGVVPPAETRDIDGLPPVLSGLLRAHAAAYHTLHQLALQNKKSIRVGMAHQLRTMDPYYPLLATDVALALAADQAFNWSLPEALETGVFRLELPFKVSWTESIPNLAGTQDFLAINYYTGDLVHLSPENGFELHPRQDLPRNDMGWPIYPEGFLRILRAASERIPGKPIMITENGTADRHDRFRKNFIASHLAIVHQALQEEIPIEGYCHWSLLDNFEWDQGYGPRFGLYDVNYKTLSRTARPSARFFAKIAKANKVTVRSDSGIHHAKPKWRNQSHQ